MCVDKLNFLNVVKGKDLQALNGGGLIGLAPIPVKGNELKDPMNHGIPGFVAQLKANKGYSEKHAGQFSIYLSNDGTSPGAMSFGGYDLNSFAKADKKDSNITWADIGANEAYWTINSASTKIGGVDIAG